MRFLWIGLIRQLPNCWVRETGSQIPNKGYVSYTVKILNYTGRGMVYIEKPCGKKAKEMAEKIAQQPSSGGGGGGSAGTGGGGGGGVLIGGGCYGSCGGRIPTGDVGPIETLPG
nr:hypothetical protein [Xanthomonas phaseoli]